MTLDLTTYSDADMVHEVSAPFAIGSNELKMHVRAKAADHSVWIELTTENGTLSVIPVSDGETITINIPRAKFLSMPAGDYVHSCVMINGASITEVWRGELTHNIGPTRWNS